MARLRYPLDEADEPQYGIDLYRETIYDDSRDETIRRYGGACAQLGGFKLAKISEAFDAGDFSGVEKVIDRLRAGRHIEFRSAADDPAKTEIFIVKDY